MTALAVLLVSATCTSAGCLLTQVLPSSGSHETLSCCAAHANHSDGHLLAGRDGRSCPLCRNSVLIGKTVDNTNPNFAPSPFSTAIFGLPPIAMVIAPQFQALAESVDATPAHGPPTLLALHCALLI